MDKEQKILAALNLGLLHTLVTQNEITWGDMKALADKGLVEVNRHGVYVLTDKGRKKLHAMRPR